MIDRIKSLLDELESKLNAVKKERDEYKFSYQQACAENANLQQRIDELEQQRTSNLMQSVDLINTKIS